MPLALDSALRSRPTTALRFLDLALAHARPSPQVLAAAGLPADEALAFWRRLRDAGEVDDAGWAPDAREAYRARVRAASPRRIAEIGAAERPREKAQRSGVAALADAELLALVLRTGGRDGVLALAERLLARHDGVVGLAGCGLDELAAEGGVGPAKAAEIAAVFELGRRLARARRRARPDLRTAAQVYACLAADLVGLRHEELWCLPLDAHSRLIGEPRVVTRGDVDGTDAGPRAFFRCALAAGATACIAAHNHPTGDATPSGADRAVTLRLAAAGRAIDVPLVDHVIVGDDGRYVSLRAVEPGLFR